LLLLLIFKLGAAPLHFWKLEIFESFRFVHFSFFSTIYFFSSLFIFQIILLQLPLLSNASAFFLFTLLIFYNLFFTLFHINSVLTLRQFLVLSALLNLNLALLSLTLTEESTHPFFLAFVISYILLAFIFYLFFIIVGSNTKYFSSLTQPQNAWLRYFFFVFPLLSLSGAAPTLAFYFKLLFLLTNLHFKKMLLISLYIFTIIFSVIFYFQLFKINTSQLLVQPEKKEILFLKNSFLIFFIFTLFSIAMLTPIFSTNTLFFFEGFQMSFNSIFSLI